MVAYRGRRGEEKRRKGEGRVKRKGGREEEGGNKKMEKRKGEGRKCNAVHSPFILHKTRALCS